jgi:hypothetical protein
VAKRYDLVIAIDWNAIHAEFRGDYKRRRMGRRLPEEATNHERLAALASRLDVPTSRCGELRDGQFQKGG